MRVRGQALAAGLLSEVEQLLLAQAALEKSACVDAGRAVALDIHQIAAVRVARGAPKMTETDVVQRGRGLETGDVSAELGGDLVGLAHDDGGVPADRGRILVSMARSPGGSGWWPEGWCCCRRCSRRRAVARHFFALPKSLRSACRPSFARPQKSEPSSGPPAIRAFRARSHRGPWCPPDKRRHLARPKLRLWRLACFRLCHPKLSHTDKS